MSIENARAFLERVKNDEDFMKESEEQASAEERIKFAKAQGFYFTKEEINAQKRGLSELGSMMYSRCGRGVVYGCGKCIDHDCEGRYV